MRKLAAAGTIFLSLAASANIVLAETKDGELAAAQNLFEQYKKLDQACDPKLIDLYAADASIESDVERKGAPLQKEKYDRAKFGTLISKTFADEKLAKISSKTVYDKAEISREALDKNAINVVFHAYQGDTAMRVHWILHREKDSGAWQIHKEHTVTFRKSLGRVAP